VTRLDPPPARNATTLAISSGFAVFPLQAHDPSSFVVDRSRATAWPCIMVIRQVAVQA
jgi:hypothetical protein